MKSDELADAALNAYKNFISEHIETDIKEANEFAEIVEKEFKKILGVTGKLDVFPIHTTKAEIQAGNLIFIVTGNYRTRKKDRVLELDFNLVRTCMGCGRHFVDTSSVYSLISLGNKLANEYRCEACERKDYLFFKENEEETI